MRTGMRASVRAARRPPKPAPTITTRALICGSISPPYKIPVTGFGSRKFSAGFGVSAPSAPRILRDRRGSRSRGHDGRALAAGHQPVVAAERYCEADEPRIVIPETQAWNDKAHE